MPKPLSDNRKYRAMTVEQADQLFQKIALLTIELNHISSGYEAKIAELKAAAVRETELREVELKILEEELTGYILANPERFIKPRQHVTEYGKYGVRQVAGLEITDEEAVKASVRLHNIPALTVIEKLDRKALEKAISEGITLDGCEMRRGEVASYTVAKALLE
ncbi:MAG: hypothetical protein E7055_03000 [Lentisphaerae bacterium]|nr:hypothetical protein [Lentisphaerota bacterium]